MPLTQRQPTRGSVGCVESFAQRTPPNDERNAPFSVPATKVPFTSISERILPLVGGAPDGFQVRPSSVDRNTPPRLVPAQQVVALALSEKMLRSVG